jgi:hypothetical protein
MAAFLLIGNECILADNADVSTMKKNFIDHTNLNLLYTQVSLLLAL